MGRVSKSELDALRRAVVSLKPEPDVAAETEVVFWVIDKIDMSGYSAWDLSCDWMDEPLRYHRESGENFPAFQQRVTASLPDFIPNREGVEIARYFIRPAPPVLDVQEPEENDNV
ncbi:MAG: hypothetical protein ABJN62_18700 [Halioglobus sp.]